MRTFASICLLCILLVQVDQADSEYLKGVVGVSSTNVPASYRQLWRHRTSSVCETLDLSQIASDGTGQGSFCSTAGGCFNFDVTGAVQYTGTDGTTIWWGFEAVSSTTHCFFVDSSTPRGGVQNSVCPVSFNIDTFSFEEGKHCGASRLYALAGNVLAVFMFALWMGYRSRSV